MLVLGDINAVLIHLKTYESPWLLDRNMLGFILIENKCRFLYLTLDPLQPFGQEFLTLYKKHDIIRISRIGYPRYFKAPVKLMKVSGCKKSSKR